MLLLNWLERWRKFQERCRQRIYMVGGQLRLNKNHLGLTRTLMDLGECAGLTSAHAVRNVPRLEDVVAKTYHVLGTALTENYSSFNEVEEISSKESSQCKREQGI